MGIASQYVNLSMGAIHHEFYCVLVLFFFFNSLSILEVCSGRQFSYTGKSKLICGPISLMCK